MAKTDFDAKLQELNKKNNSNKAKHVLIENELKKLNNFDAAYFRCKYYFGDDGTQTYLVFQSKHKYFEWVSGVDSEILSWESKGLPSKNQHPNITYSNARIALLFNGDL